MGNSAYAVREKLRIEQDEDDRAVAVLVREAQEGNKSAFADLYLRFFDRIYAYLRVALGSEQDAEDASQHVFVKAMEALPRYRQGEQPWRAWLFRIARNEALDHLRRRGRVSPEEPMEIERRQEPVPSEELRALRWTTDDDLVLLVERLPEAQKQAIVLRYVLGFEGPEVAQILNRTPDAVRQLQLRALRFLEQRLVALGREPSSSGRRGRRLQMCARGREGALRSMHAFTLAR